MPPESLIDRPLTIKQRFALRAVAEGDYVIKERLGRGHIFHEVSTRRGAPIGGQLRALKRRGFICWGRPGGLALTLAGAFELFFDARKLCFCLGSGVEFVDGGHGNVYDIPCSACQLVTEVT